MKSLITEVSVTESGNSTDYAALCPEDVPVLIGDNYSYRLATIRISGY